VADDALVIETIVDAALWEEHAPALARALGAAARAEAAHGLVNLLLADDAAMAQLNRAWRGRDAPTNVLSFPAAANDFGLIGDIALGAETIAAEAREQGKSLADHAAHMAVHGFLHLLGYDHGDDSAAEAMEARERAILAELGVADPYAARTREPAGAPRSA
jgi:probable rRNA maturation factor